MDDRVTLKAPPVLEFLADGPDGPTLLGSTSRYEKRVGDLEGVYADRAAFAELSSADPDRIVYWVDESRAGEQPGALVIGMSALEPGKVGEEYFVTRGHLHGRAGCAEFYYCVSGQGLLLMDDLHGETSVAELRPGVGVHVPGGWLHRSVNVGSTAFVTLFSYDADAGQNYTIIANAGGMRRRIVADGDGWRAVPNPGHLGYAS